MLSAVHNNYRVESVYLRTTFANILHMKLGYRALLLLAAIPFLVEGYGLFRAGQVGFTNQIGQTGFAGALIAMGVMLLLIAVLPAPPAKWFAGRKRSGSRHP